MAGILNQRIKLGIREFPRIVATTGGGFVDNQKLISHSLVRKQGFSTFQGTQSTCFSASRL
jgi:hypothetical protein